MPQTHRIPHMKRVYVVILVTHVRLLVLLGIIATHVGFTFHRRGRTEGVCSVSSTMIIKCVGMFPFKTQSPSTSAVAGHINTVCRSVKQLCLFSPLSLSLSLKIKHIVCRVWLISPGETWEMEPPPWRAQHLPVGRRGPSRGSRFPPLSYDWWLTPTSCVFIAVCHSVP